MVYISEELTHILYTNQDIQIAPGVFVTLSTHKLDVSHDSAHRVYEVCEVRCCI